MSGVGERRASTLDPSGEFPFDIPTFLFHLFVVISRHRELRIDAALKPLGLNVARHRAISVIARLEPCAMNELAEFAAVDRTTLTRTVDQLVQSGWVERTTPKADRRQVLLTLTRDGREVFRKALKAVYRVNIASLEAVPESESRIAARALRKIAANLVGDADLARRVIGWEDKASQPR
jgi:DNA-binding MarR family transcriptional regulator